MVMKEPTASRRSSPRVVKDRQLALVENPTRDLQTTGPRELQVDDDWEERLDLQVKVMCVFYFVDPLMLDAASNGGLAFLQECRGYGRFKDTAGSQDHRIACAQRGV